MKSRLIDTNVIVRFFVEDPEKTHEKFKGVFSFLKKVEMGEIAVELPELVLFETFYVLTKTYKEPPGEVAQKLHDLMSFKGILMRDKPFISLCLKKLLSKNIGLLDAYLLAASEKKGVHEIYSYDTDLSKYGLTLIKID